MTPPSFDLCGPLPSGTQLLEASAGTGKTYAIAALATRYIAEGRVTIDQLLLITFGRAATQELRERVRRRLIDTHRALGQPDAHRADDPVVALLAQGIPAEVTQRRTRLDQALTSFDQATIETTHAFCQSALNRLGIAADADPLESLAENTSVLTQDVVTDLYLARFGSPGAAGPPALGVGLARDIARAAIADPLADLDAGAAPPGTEAAARQEFAEAVRAEHRRRRRQLGITTFDDLLTRVDAALADPVTGARARQLLREQFPVVMVDEFQDTDPVQWRILERAFHSHSTLILIGDPKQAIYAFRGGDVATYLRAADTADGRSTLTTNRRSDAALVEQVTRLFEGIELGAERITVHQVDVHHTARRLHGGAADAPLRVRTLPDPGGKTPGVDRLREAVADDVADDVVRRLTGTGRLDDGGVSRALRPGDLAVLVNTNREADLVHDALRRAGVHAVVTANEDVFGSRAATHWLVLLRALEKPQRTGLIRAAMITPFLGHTGTDLAAGGDELVDECAQTVRGWAARFRLAGIAGVVERMTPGMTAPVLSHPDGERLLTDIRHVGEELHAKSRTTGLSGLIEWLTARIADSSRESEEAARRLDTDTDAVQIVTVHRSKGLEFPVTYVPFAWSRHVGDRDEHLRLHDAAGRRILDVRGPTAPDWSDNTDRHRDEDAGESLRLLYVAFTRARCQLVTWWVRGYTTPAAPLQRLVGTRLTDTSRPQLRYPTTTTGLAQVGEVLGVPVEVATGSGLHWQPPTGESAADLSAAAYDRTVDVEWRRTSYSALTAAAHDAAYRDQEEVSDDERQDEPAEPISSANPAAAGLVSPMVDLPVGASFGLVAHEVYELFDSRAADQNDELLRCARTALAHRPLGDLTPGQIADAFLPSITTPLGPLADDRSLGEIHPRDRLAELDFEFPLAGGDAVVCDVTLRDLGRLVDEHLPADDPLHEYPERMRHDGLTGQRLAGFLSGSIDAVFRVPGVAGGPDRFVISDYKTNWVGGSIPDRRLHAQDYTTDAMAAAMMHAHYPLQALLYQVALHRFLRWRLPGYRPDEHLGGVLYLFVRGMCGPQTPRAGPAPTGVFQWCPPTPLIVALSDRLGGRT